MRYSERVLPGPVWWLGVAGVAIIFGIMFIPVSQLLSLSASLAVLAFGVVALLLASYQITITESEIQVGRAKVRLDHLKNPQAIDSHAWSDQLGHSDDLTEFSITRPWVRTGIRCELVDPRDPVQTWLIGSRSPERITEYISSYAAHSEQTGNEFSS